MEESLEVLRNLWRSILAPRQFLFILSMNKDENHYISPDLLPLLKNIIPCWNESLQEEKAGNHLPFEGSKLNNTLSSLQKYIGVSWIDKYVKEYYLAGGIKAIKLVDPRDLLILGDCLYNLQLNLSTNDFNKLVDKIKYIKLDGADVWASQLKDLIYEIENMALFSQSGFKIEVEKPTGVLSTDGERNADLYLPGLDIYVEVKANYPYRKETMRHFNEKAYEVFRAPEKFGNLYKVDKSKNYQIDQIGNLNQNGTQIFIEIPAKDAIKSLTDKIKVAGDKFSSNQKAILIISGVINLNAIDPACNRFWDSNPKSPIQAIAAREDRKWGCRDNEWIPNMKFIISRYADEKIVETINQLVIK